MGSVWNDGLGQKNKPKRKRKSPVSFVPFEQVIEKGRVELTLPIETVSEANSFEHWTDKHKRHTKQKKSVTLNMLAFKNIITLPCKMIFKRFAPGSLDKRDNLPMSLKYVVDATCAMLTGDFRPGRADNNPLLDWSYDQEVSKKYGVKILFEF